MSGVEAAVQNKNAIGQKRRHLAIDEASIEFLGRAAQPAAFDESLLTTMPASEITKHLGEIVSQLRQVRFDSVLRKQGIFSRLTGADVEAKLKFEIAVRLIIDKVNALDHLITSAKKIKSSLINTNLQIQNEQKKLRKVIAAAQSAATLQVNVPKHLADRFNRKLSDLITLEASNIMTVEQIELAIKNLNSLLDRIQEVLTVVFPLWQRDALAIAQATAPTLKNSSLANSFAENHDKLIAKLA